MLDLIWNYHFFLFTVAKGLTTLLLSSKNQLLFSLVNIISLFFILLISDLYYFIPSYCLTFVCSFVFNFLTWTLKLLNWNLLPFLALVFIWAYLILLYFTLLQFTDTAFFTNLRFVATLYWASLSVPFFQQHLLISCLCVTFS